jgi:hypothetical protein
MSKSKTANESHAGEGLPWFKFWAARWLNSETVQKMSDTHRGIFIQILSGCWVYGELTRDPWRLSRQLLTNYRTTALWLQKYSDLLVDGQSGSSYFTVPKLDELQVLKGKSTPDAAGEENRGDKSRGDFIPPDGGRNKNGSEEGKHRGWTRPPNAPDPGDPDCQTCSGRGQRPVRQKEGAHKGRIVISHGVPQMEPCPCAAEMQGRKQETTRLRMSMAEST